MATLRGRFYSLGDLEVPRPREAGPWTGLLRSEIGLPLRRGLGRFSSLRRKNGVALQWLALLSNAGTLSNTRSIMETNVHHITSREMMECGKILDLPLEENRRLNGKTHVDPSPWGQQMYLLLNGLKMRTSSG